MSGKTLKRNVKVSDFIPRYVNEKPAVKSLETQAVEFAAFAAKLKAVQGKTS